MWFAHGETVTVLPGSVGTDADGEPVPDTRTGGDIERCAIAFRYSTEPTARGRNGVIVGLTVFAPFGSDITSTDSLMIRGNRYVVDGEPAEWRSPFTGWEPGIEVAARRAEG